MTDTTTTNPTNNPTAIELSTEHERALRIKNQIINVILASPLNIPFIPDDIERDIYLAILSELEPILTSRSFWQKVGDFFKRIFCCAYLTDDDDTLPAPPTPLTPLTSKKRQ
jgi:hypothetical protein